VKTHQLKKFLACAKSISGQALPLFAPGLQLSALGQKQTFSTDQPNVTLRCLSLTIRKKTFDRLKADPIKMIAGWVIDQLPKMEETL
jgi:hypothetical protein